MTRAHDPALSRAERRVVEKAMRWSKAAHALQAKDEGPGGYVRAFMALDAACAALERSRREARKGKRR